MTAPQVDRAPHQEAAPEAFWARRTATSAVHHWEYSAYARWQSACGLRGVASKEQLLPESATSVFLCSRCVRARERVATAGSRCGLPTCVGCNPATEDLMLTWLQNWYRGRSGGNGERFMFARHVRARAGFDARTADAVVMDLWQSKGLELHGIEVKISRNDWKVELRNADKWRPVGRYMDRWWLAVPDAAIVKKGELPESWGLLVCSADGIRVSRPAPKLEPDPVDRSFLAALVRAAAKTGAVE